MWKKFLLHRHFKGMKYTGKQTGRVLQNFVSIFFSKKIGLGWEENRILFLSTSKEVKTKPVAGCLIFVRCTLVFQDALVFYTIFPKHNIHEICILCFFFPSNRILCGLKMYSLYRTPLRPCSYHLLQPWIMAAWKSGVKEYHLLMKT